jgi:hypothetical protein
VDNGRKVTTFALPNGYSILTADGSRIITADEEGTIYSFAVVEADEN